MVTTNAKNHPTNHVMPRKGAPPAKQAKHSRTHVVEPEVTAEAERVGSKVLSRPGKAEGLRKPPGIKNPVVNS